MNSTQEIARKMNEEAEVDAAKINAEETKPSAGPQVMLGIALIGFVGFMVNSWHRQLTALETTPKATATATVVEKKVSPEVETEKTPEKFKTSSAAALLNVVPNPVVAPAAEITEAAEITPEEAIADLSWDLYSKIDGAWRISPTFNQSLVYRIAVHKNGEVIDYEALNKVAEDHLGETGIDTLKKTDSFIADDEPENSRNFLAVLTPQGLLYVSPLLEK